MNQSIEGVIRFFQSSYQLYRFVLQAAPAPTSAPAKTKPMSGGPLSKSLVVTSPVMVSRTLRSGRSGAAAPSIRGTIQPLPTIPDGVPVDGSLTRVTPGDYEARWASSVARGLSVADPVIPLEPMVSPVSDDDKEKKGVEKVYTPADIHTASTSVQRKALAMAVKHIMKGTKDMKQQSALATNAFFPMIWDIMASYGKLPGGKLSTICKSHSTASVVFAMLTGFEHNWPAL